MPTTSDNGSDNDDRKPAAIDVFDHHRVSSTTLDDDDNWSHHVETDETAAGAFLHDESFRMESVQEEGEEEATANNSIRNPSPYQPELSLKEKLVLRERERRIETERARLKRIFANNNNHDPGNTNDAADEELNLNMPENGSVAEESTKAYPDEEYTAETTGNSLGFNMERFLRNSDTGTFDPQLESTLPDDETNKVVMQRFLNDPVELDQQRSVSVDTLQQRNEAPKDEAFLPPEPFLGSYIDDHDDNHSSDKQEDDLHNHTEEPRVLRLTEADMQEMVAMDQVSIGNAPPSEREDEELSEIGELADFGRRHITTFSEDTPTTAQDSASMQSELNNMHLAHFTTTTTAKTHSTTSEDQVSMNDEASINETHPPSVIAADDELPQQLVDNSLLVQGRSIMPLGPEEVPGDNEVVLNRTIRPGMVHLQSLQQQTARNPSADVASMPREPIVVEGFDFDKDAPTSPLPNQSLHCEDSYRDLPLDSWSPAGKMQVSPIGKKRMTAIPAVIGEESDENNLLLPRNENDLSATSEFNRTDFIPFKHQTRSISEVTPLLATGSKDLFGGVPPEIVTRRTMSEANMKGTALVGNEPRRFDINRQSLVSQVDSVFSDVRSEEESSVEAVNNESEFYKNSSIFARAFPERIFALTVTLIFEIPVLLMISGGSDALCGLVGRTRYQLLMGFIPLTSAISGNVGLQASTLTTRAISHRHVTTKSYFPWFVAEVGAAACLGCGMGFLLGSIAFFASGMDLPFGLTIMFAQFISIVTAGFTGTFAPLLFSFIFKRDSGKWGGPLETAIQDIVGSFAMVVLSFHILKSFGVGPLSPDDVCRGVGT
jgi:hypothetical protein